MLEEMQLTGAGMETARHSSEQKTGEGGKEGGAGTRGAVLV